MYRRSLTKKILENGFLEVEIGQFEIGNFAPHPDPAEGLLDGALHHRRNLADGQNGRALISVKAGAFVSDNAGWTLNHDYIMYDWMGFGNKASPNIGRERMTA